MSAPTSAKSAPQPHNFNDKLLCYLTDEASHAINVMVEAGFDLDLAVVTLEKLWPEDAIWTVPYDEACYIGEDPASERETL